MWGRTVAGALHVYNSLLIFVVVMDNYRIVRAFLFAVLMTFVIIALAIMAIQLFDHLYEVL